MCMYFTNGIKKDGHMLCIQCKENKDMHPIFIYIYNFTSQCDDIVLLIQEYIKVDGKTIDYGYEHQVRLLQNNTIECYGDNEFGQCEIPNSIQGKVISIECGNYYSCALLFDNTIKCWGDNFYGQCYAPDSVQGRIISISCGLDTMCAILDDNTVKRWGNNTDGRCIIPKSIQGRVVSINNKHYKPCVYLNDGSDICW